MKKLSLAARYRPQTFAEVAGQDMVKTVLSRAAAEDKVAAAYLLSGTRGVGKTTIARIFAKALNCEHAPTAEPCNECAQCRKITQGSHVDVAEIDGASNNSVEDARALRETIGYAPMEGRYKVFIIDEAHMLSRSAFNALLKTLEEPPARVVFIFATTEAHKFRRWKNPRRAWSSSSPRRKRTNFPLPLSAAVSISSSGICPRTRWPRI